MKKLLTGVVIVAIVLLVVFLIAGFLGPKGFKMERSIDINAPRAVVYKNISDYKNWMKWSPWVKLDSNCVYDYYGSQKQVGAGFKWKGNAKAGEGDMHTLDMTENDSLTSQLTFIKPWSAEAIEGFKLVDGANGSTKLTWTFNQEFSFMKRPFMLFMNMEKMLGPDYENGLANLKAISEKEAINKPAMEVKEVIWAARNYVADRVVTKINDLSNAFMDRMPKAFAYAQKNNMVVDGAAAGIYYTWDTTSGTTDLAIAIPVKDASKASGSYSDITIDRSRALLVDYYGPYDKMKPAHDAIHQYAKDKGLKLKFPNIEEYVGDPGAEKDPNKVLTKIYYLIQD
jgi:effector-binding domain-containing protein